MVSRDSSHWLLASLVEINSCTETHLTLNTWGQSTRSLSDLFFFLLFRCYPTRRKRALEVLCVLRYISFSKSLIAVHKIIIIEKNIFFFFESNSHGLFFCMSIVLVCSLTAILITSRHAVYSPLPSLIGNLVLFVLGKTKKGYLSNSSAIINVLCNH